MKRIQYDRYGGAELMRLDDFGLAVCTPRPDILDGLARAAREGKFRLPIAEIVPLSEAIQLVTALEAGRKLGGKGLVVMG